MSTNHHVNVLAEDENPPAGNIRVEERLTIYGTTSNLTIPIPPSIPRELVPNFVHAIRYTAATAAAASINGRGNPIQVVERHPFVREEWYTALTESNKLVFDTAFIQGPENTNDLIRQGRLKYDLPMKDLEEEADYQKCTKHIYDMARQLLQQPWGMPRYFPVSLNITDLEDDLVSALVPYLTTQEVLNLDYATYHRSLTTPIWRQILISRQLDDADFTLSNLIRTRNGGRFSFKTAARMVFQHSITHSGTELLRFTEKSGRFDEGYMTAASRLIFGALYEDLDFVNPKWLTKRSEELLLQVPTTTFPPILNDVKKLLAYVDCYYVDGDGQPSKIGSLEAPLVERPPLATEGRIIDFYFNGVDSSYWEIPATLGELYDRIGDEVFKKENGLFQDPRTGDPAEFLVDSELITFKFRLFRCDTGQAISWSYDGSVATFSSWEFDITTGYYNGKDSEGDVIGLGDPVALVYHNVGYEARPSQVESPEGKEPVRLNFNEDTQEPLGDISWLSNDATTYRIYKRDLRFAIRVEIPTDAYEAMDEPPNSALMFLNGLRWK